MTPDIPFLKLLGDELAEMGQAVQFLGAAESGLPADRLYVWLGKLEETPLILELSFINDILISLGVPESRKDAIILQFLVRFPFESRPGCESEVAWLLHDLSRLFPTGAFGYSPEDRALFYQYAHQGASRSVSKRVVLRIFLSIQPILNQLAPLIREVAAGAKTRNQALRELQEAGVKIPPIHSETAKLRESQPNTISFA